MSALRRWLALTVGTTSPDTQFFREPLFLSLEEFETVTERCNLEVVVPIRLSKVILFRLMAGRMEVRPVA